MNFKTLSRWLSFKKREEKREETNVVALIDEIISDNTNAQNSEEIVAGSTIQVRVVERKRLSFDYWAKKNMGLFYDSSSYTEYEAEQVILNLKQSQQYQSLENRVKLLVNLSGVKDDTCCRFHREVNMEEGHIHIKVTLYVWHYLKNPPPKILRDGAAIKLTERGKTYDYVCSGGSYNPSSTEEVRCNSTSV